MVSRVLRILLSLLVHIVCVSPSSVDSVRSPPVRCAGPGCPPFNGPLFACQCSSQQVPRGPPRSSPPPAPGLASLPGHGASCGDCEWWPPRVELGPPALLGSLSERRLCAWILSDSLRAVEHSGALLPLQESDRSRTVFKVSLLSAH